MIYHEEIPIINYSIIVLRALDWLKPVTSWFGVANEKRNQQPTTPSSVGYHIVFKLNKQKQMQAK